MYKFENYTYMLVFLKRAQSFLKFFLLKCVLHSVRTLKIRNPIIDV